MCHHLESVNSPCCKYLILSNTTCYQATVDLGPHTPQEGLIKIKPLSKLLIRHLTGLSNTHHKNVHVFLDHKLLIYKYHTTTLDIESKSDTDNGLNWKLGCICRRVLQSIMEQLTHLPRLCFLPEVEVVRSCHKWTVRCRWWMELKAYTNTICKWYPF